MLDPLARQSHAVLGQALYAARRYEEAVAAFTEAISLDPYYKTTYGSRGLAYYALGDLTERARFMRGAAEPLVESTVPLGDL